MESPLANDSSPVHLLPVPKRLSVPTVGMMTLAAPAAKLGLVVPRDMKKVLKAPSLYLLPSLLTDNGCASPVEYEQALKEEVKVEKETEDKVNGNIETEDKSEVKVEEKTKE